MVKYSKSLVVLLGTASVFAAMPIQLVKAEELGEEKRSSFTRMASIPGDLWEALPSYEAVKNATWAVKESVQAKGTAYAKEKAQSFFDQKAGQAAEIATKKLHALMYRHADIHIVNDDGKHVGYVEDLNPRVGRNLIKKALGIDLDSALPGVPTFMAKAIINVIEKQAANYLEANFQKNLNIALTQLSMDALQKGLGLAANKVNLALTNVPNPAPAVEEEKAIEAELKKIVPANESIDQVELSLMGELVMAIQANLKLKIHTWINEVANETATTFTSEFVKQTSEQILRKTEVVSGAVATATVGAITGGTGAVIAGGLIAGDTYVADAVPGDDSYMRQFVKWVSGFDKRKEDIQTKVTIAATNQINGNIDTVFNNVGLGSLVLTEQDRELVFGKYESKEDEDGFTNMTLVQEPFSLSTFGNRIADHLQKKVTEAASAAYQQVQEKATQVGTAMQEHAEIFADTAYDFTMAFGPGLAYEDSEPTKLEKLQEELSMVKDAYSAAVIEQEIAEEKAAVKPWYKFW